MDEVTGIILAGGKSTRMGTDKGLMLFEGQPMIQHIIEPMAKVCSRIIIVTTNSYYRIFGCDLIKDEQPNYGPVMGVLSGLKGSKTELNLILSCDTPNVGIDLMKALLNTTGNSDIVAASSSTGIHPLIGVYNRKCLPTFERAVAEKEHRLQSVLEKLSVKTLTVEDEDLVKNMNRKEDLE